MANSGSFLGHGGISVPVGNGSEIKLLSDHTVYRFAFDADGSIFNAVYYRLKRQGASEDEAVLGACKSLFEFILAVVNASAHPEVTVIISSYSSRLAAGYDYTNSVRNETSLFLKHVLPLLFKHIQTLPFKKKIKCLFDKQTIYDILEQKPDGTGLDAENDTFCSHEPDKIFLTIAGAHRTAHLFPEDNIGIFVFDDHCPILSGVKNFLSEPQIQPYMPSSVTHYVQHFGDVDDLTRPLEDHEDGTKRYAAKFSGIVTPLAAVKGLEAGCDAEYKETICHLYNRAPKDEAGHVKNLLEFIFQGNQGILRIIRQELALPPAMIPAVQSPKPAGAGTSRIRQMLDGSLREDHFSSPVPDNKEDDSDFLDGSYELLDSSEGKKPYVEAPARPNSRMPRM